MHLRVVHKVQLCCILISPRCTTGTAFSLYRVLSSAGHGTAVPPPRDSAVLLIYLCGKAIGMTRTTTLREVTGSALAIVYALLIASNTGNEVIGFALLLISSGLFAGWAVIDRRWAFLSLQFFYAASATLGLIRWA